MKYETITTDADLRRFCRDASRASSICFDTEFVAEYTYRPLLCLVQLSVDGALAVIDPLAATDLAPLWRLLAEGDHESIVHAGRQELIFCFEAQGAAPRRLFDTQIAAGLVGSEYPAGYGNLLSKLVGRQLRKGETRTDWRQRPLSKRQLDYALEDVLHLPPLHAALQAQLAANGRVAWMEAEMAAWQEEILRSLDDQRWRRVAGSSNLPARQLAIVRELWHWREAEAERRDVPTRRVLRDDLIVELAKRRQADPQQISAVRGMDRGDLRRLAPALAACVGRALELPDRECPKPLNTAATPEVSMLGRFLSTALACICRQVHVAPSLVGTTGDVQDLILHKLGVKSAAGSAPRLTQGWRAEVVGQLLDDLLAGKVAIRISDLTSERPLVFDHLDA